MSFKKIAFAASLVLAPTFINAFDIIHSEKPFTGLYIVGRLGGSNLGGDYQYQVTNDNGKITMSGYGAAFGAGIGYMMLTESKAWFGGEIYYDKNTAKPSKKMMNTTDEGTVTIENKSSLGASLLVGAAASPKFVMYARAGFERQSFSFGYADLTTPPASKSVKTTFNMFVPGAGGFFKLSDKVMLGADYTYALATKDMSPSSDNPVDTYKPSEQRLVITLRVVF